MMSPGRWKLRFHILSRQPLPSENLLISEGSCGSKLLWSGAGDGDRTHDIQLGKLTFYH